VKRSRQASDRLTKGVGFLMKKNNVTVYMGSARLSARDAVSITDNAGKITEIKSKNIIIASGAQTMVPPAWKVDGKRIITYLEAILQTTLPDSAIIIGAGAIGVEFATIWNSYGVPVTIVEMLPRLLPLEDEEVSSELARAFAKRKITTW
jgi:dihydrolipoamide dehydrogenase